ncbi:MAG: ABC transporter permease [Dehalococcoidia bacterium]
MLMYVTRRLLLAIPTLFLVILIVFTAVRVVPTDIADLLVADSTSSTGNTEAVKAAIRKELHLDRPIPIQLGYYLLNMAKGDIGRSAYDTKPVATKIYDALPVTLEVAFLAMTLSTVMAIGIGVLSALRQDTFYDYGIRLLTIFAFAAPVFWIGTLAIVLPARWGYFPPLFFVSFLDDPIANLQQFLMPAAVLAMNLMGSVARMVRSSMLEVLRQDYIRTAYAKGLQTRVVITRHALRNGFIPVLTFLALQLSNLLGGSVIIESIFALPGVGTLTVNAISTKDYTVIQGCVLFFGCIVVVMNLLVDVSYGFIDPRLRRS